MKELEALTIALASVEYLEEVAITDDAEIKFRDAAIHIRRLVTLKKKVNQHGQEIRSARVEVSTTR